MVIFLSTAGLVSAKEQNKKLGVTFDFTYVSKYMSKGVESYGQHGGFFKSLDLDFYGSGFGVNVMHRNAIGSGYVDKQRFDFRPYYKNTAFERESYAINYNISTGYEYYPGLARQKSNTTWEWIFSFSWPEILPGNLVPSYIAHYEYGAGEGYTTQSNADIETGWVHRFILGYDLQTEQLPNPLHLSSEVAYTDGLGGAGHDWSYATFGLSSKFPVTKNMTFIPGIYHQLSMEDTVNTHKDVTYCKLGMRYKF